MSSIDFYKKVSMIQVEINAPKSQWNAFGKYSYRNCDDIMQAIKPHLKKHELHLLMNDEVTFVLDRVYVKAVVTITDGTNKVEASAMARESLSKKGMDDSQITGTASSYARKYALNGLLALDDNKDPDSDITIDDIVMYVRAENLEFINNHIDKIRKIAKQLPKETTDKLTEMRNNGVLK